MLAGFCAVLGLALLPAGNAAAVSAPFQVSGFYQVLADPAHGHLFVSPGGGHGDSVIVTSLAGRQIAAIGGLDGAAGMALSADGGTLYVALRESDAVRAIDTGSLSQVATYPLGTGDSPAAVAVEDGMVWVSYYTASGPDGPGGYLGEINPAAAPASAFTAPALPGKWDTAPQIAVDPLGAGALVAAGRGGDSVGSFNVSTTPPTVNRKPAQAAGCARESDLAVLPGGAQFLMACGNQKSVLRYDTSTLEARGAVYPGASDPTTVAVTPGGMVAVGTGTNPDVHVYLPRATAPVNAYTLRGSSGIPVPLGLAWSADGSRLFQVFRASAADPDVYVVRTFGDPVRTESALSLRGPRSAVLGGRVPLTGKLAVTVGKPPAGTSITITRTLTGNGAIRRFTVRLAANDTFRLTDKPGAIGRYTYTATYGGDSARQPATARPLVTLVRFPVTLTLRASPAYVVYRRPVTVTAHLGRTYTGRTVSVYARPFGARTARLLKTGLVNAGGNLSVRVAPYHSTAFSVVFAGDGRYAPRSVTSYVYVLARVSESVSGYYASTRIGGVLYRVYHHTDTLRLGAAVAPDKHGECAQATLEIYYRGRWYSATTRCKPLSSSSTFTTLISLTKDSGFRFRIRVGYFRSSNDITNLNNYSAWAYFEVGR